MLICRGSNSKINNITGKPCCSIPEAAGQILNEKGDAHYVFLELQKNFTQAIASCNSYDMKLVALETEEEYNMVFSALPGRKLELNYTLIEQSL